jgi:CPA2 family monovalent cation:H+ antiporter-2
MEVAFYRHDRQSLRDLAELWKPGVPISENTAYVERSRELNANLETALLSQLDEMASEAPEGGHRRRPGDAGALRGTMDSRVPPRRPGGRDR